MNVVCQRLFNPIVDISSVAAILFFMSRERGSDEGQRHWRPNAEFFLSNPRSAELRDVCIGIARRVEDLIYNPEVTENRDRQLTIYAELEMLGGKLIEMDISPEMNTGLPLEVYKSNPVTTAEYIAGQLYPFTGHSVISEKEIIPVTQELNETDLETVSLMENRIIPNKMRRFLVERRVISFIRDSLDIPEPNEEES